MDRDFAGPVVVVFVLWLLMVLGFISFIAWILVNFVIPAIKGV